MNKNMIHPDLMASLEDFFPDSCDIESPADNEGDYGDTEQKTWTAVYSEVDALKSEWNVLRSGDEVRRNDGTIVKHPYKIMLKGDYTILETYRAKVDSEYYDILAVHHDSRAEMTLLICEKVK